MSLLKRMALCTLLLILLTNRTVLAKGPPDKITVTGPGLPGEIEITDSQTVDSFSMGKFVDFNTPINEPNGLDVGYEITRWYRVGGTALKAIDRFDYYANPRGNNGYVFYEGIIDKMFIYGGSPNDGKWFRVTEGGELAMRQIFTEYGVPTAVNSSQLTLPTEFLTWVGYGGLLVIGGAVFFLAYRRKQISSQVST